MRSQSRLFLILALFVATSIGLSACGDPAQSGQGLRKITIVEAGAQHFRLPAYVALEKGLFRQHGLDVEIVEAKSGSQTAQLVAGRQAEFGLGQLVDTVNLVKNNVQAQGIAILTGRITNNMIVRKDIAASATSLDVLASRTVGVTAVGSGTWQFALHMARAGGVDASKIQFIDAGSTAPNSLRSGRVDILSWSGPQSVELVEDGVAEWLVNPQQPHLGLTPRYPAIQRLAASPYLNNWIYATSSYIEDNPEVAQNVVNALDDAVKWINSTDTRQVAMTARGFDEFNAQEPQTFDTTVVRLIESGGIPESVRIPREAYDNAMTYLTSVGQRYSPVPYEELVDNSFAEKAAAR